MSEFDTIFQAMPPELGQCRHSSRSRLLASARPIEEHRLCGKSDRFFMMPGTGRLADGHVVQWSMDGFHNAQSPFGTNFLDGDSAPATADFTKHVRDRDQTLGPSS